MTSVFAEWVGGTVCWWSEILLLEHYLIPCSYQSISICHGERICIITNNSCQLSNVNISGNENLLSRRLDFDDRFSLTSTFSRDFQTIFARLYFRAASNSDRHVSKCQQISKASVINRTRASLFSRNNVLAFHAGNISTLKCIEYRILNVSTSSEIRVVNKTDKLAKCSNDSKQKHLTSMSGWSICSKQGNFIIFERQQPILRLTYDKEDHDPSVYDSESGWAGLLHFTALITTETTSLFLFSISSDDSKLDD